MRVALLAAGVLLALPAHAAIVHESTGTSAQASAAAVELPTATNSAGEWVLAGCGGRDTADTTIDIDETGFQTNEIVSTNTAGVDTTGIVDIKVSSGSEPANLSCVSTSLNVIKGQSVTLSGIHADVYDATTQFSGGLADSTTFATPAITTNTANAWVCSFMHKESGNTSMTEPSGYTVIISPNAANFSGNMQIGLACIEKATPGTETPGVWTATAATTDWGGFTFALKAAEAGPTWDTGPTFTAIAGGQRLTGTTTGATTSYLCSLLASAADPTPAQCAAGTGGGVIAVQSDATPASTSIDLTNAFPRLKWCGTAVDGASNYIAISCTVANRLADADETIVTLTSVAATSILAVQSDNTGDTTSGSPIITGMHADNLLAYVREGSEVTVSSGFGCDPCVVEAIGVDSLTLSEPATSTVANVTASVATYYNPAVATSDVIEYNDTTSDSKVATWGADGTLSIAAIGSAYQTLAYNICDVSAACNFTSGPSNWGTEDLIHLNVVRPSLSPQTEPIVLILNQAGQVVYAGCDDPQALATVTTSPNSPPTGMTLGTDGAIDGTPTVEDETVGVQLLLHCRSASGLWATPTYGPVLYVSDDEIAAPACVGDTVEVCLPLLAAARPWLQSEGQLSATFACDAMVASGDIRSQDPAAMGVMTAYEPLVVSVSTGMCPGRGINRFGMSPF